MVYMDEGWAQSVEQRVGTLEKVVLSPDGLMVAIKTHLAKIEAREEERRLYEKHQSEAADRRDRRINLIISILSAVGVLVAAYVGFMTYILTTHKQAWLIPPIAQTTGTTYAKSDLSAVPTVKSPY